MRIATAVLLALLVSIPVARAETGAEQERPGVLARLGTPAQPEVVVSLLSELDPADTNAAVRLAHALGHAGGCGAVPGILQLMSHRADEVRLAAMEAAGRTGLRVEELARRLRRIAREGSPTEMRAAVEALGRVGDGRDATALLDLTHSEDVRLRTVAFHALENLTGAKMPFVRARWMWHWKGFRERAERLLPHVLIALEDAVDGPDRQALADLVRRYGWLDAAELRLTLAEFLVAPDRDLRALACWIVGKLRLADLAPAVRECLRFAAQQEHRKVAREALAALGYLVEERALSTRGD